MNVKFSYVLHTKFNVYVHMSDYVTCLLKVPIVLHARTRVYTQSLEVHSVLHLPLCSVVVSISPEFSRGTEHVAPSAADLSRSYSWTSGPRGFEVLPLPSCKE